ncbi:hypothetical protein OG500_12255 [Kitasatospora sp. NBC_01250]|uniref:hypothetical protein n=1 Tax=unclassified Kitasatospora TaxID=2633591 RepID=UPI002E0FC501|nr:MULTISPECIES: hypothetical protein [unclassified Kitasatospora]WSJ66905.1 hypothetical protein OG294_12710 [Kitasatospora sp. NBC_01302]
MELAAIAHPNPADHSGTLGPVLGGAVMVVAVLLAGFGLVFLFLLARHSDKRGRAYGLGTVLLAAGLLAGWLGYALF